MDEINKITGRDYKLFNYYGAPDAEEVIVVMYAYSEAVKETVDYLNANGRKVGMVQIHLYRPFSSQALLRGHSRHGQEDRCPGPQQRNRFRGRARVPGRGHRSGTRPAAATSAWWAARYGLSSRTPTPASSSPCMTTSSRRIPRTTSPLGIIDDVTHTSLDYKEVELAHPGEVACKL